jgi:hypothetical protein
MNSPTEIVLFARRILSRMDTKLTLDEAKAELSRQLRRRELVAHPQRSVSAESGR